MRLIDTFEIAQRYDAASPGDGPLRLIATSRGPDVDITTPESATIARDITGDNRLCCPPHQPPDYSAAL